MELQKLIVPLELDKKNFDAGLDSALGALGSLGVAAAAGIAALTAAAAAFVGVATAAVNASFDWAEQLDKLGDITGMDSKQLAAWTYVTKKAGVSVDTLTKGITILEKGLVKEDGTLDTVGKSLEAWGIDIKDVNGKVKDQSVLMDDIAKKYQSFSTQQERVNFLTSVFGRSGADLIDVFDTLANEGGIDAVTDKVQKLGLVLDASQYEEIGRSINEVKLTFIGLANAFTGPLLPGLQKLVDLFKEWLQSPWVIETVGRIGESIGRLIDDINIGLTTGDWSKFWGDANDIWESLKTKVREALQKALDWLNAGGDQKITGFFNDLIDGLTGKGANLNGASPGIVDLAVKIIAALATAILAADWGQVTSSINTKLSEMNINTPLVGFSIVGLAALLIFNAIATAIGTVISVLTAVSTGVLNFAGFLTKVSAAVASATHLVYWFNAGIWEIIAAFLNWAAGISTVATYLADTFTAALGGSAGMIGTLIATVLYFLAVIGLWVVAISAVVRHWDELGQAITNFWNVAKFAFSSFDNYLFVMRNIAKQVFGDIGGFIRNTMNVLLDLLSLGHLQFEFSSPSFHNLPGHAAGGDAEGLTWVGERGPELVSLPRGSHVYNAQESGQMGFDYYLFAKVLAGELAKVTN